MKQPTKDVLLGLLLAAVMLALALFAISGCKVADKATIETTLKKQRIEFNEDLDMQLSSREGNVRSTVNSAIGMTLVVLAGQAGLVTAIIFLANRWQIRKLMNGGE